MKQIFKYSILVLLLLTVNLSFAGDSSDKYSFKFIESKVYDGKTDIWLYQIYKNEILLKNLNVYVTSGFDGSRILVDFDFNTSWNMFYLSNKRSVDNLWNSFRLREFTVNSLQEAVNMAVDQYIQDQIINK